MNLKDKLGKQRIFVDGGCGTILQANGLQAGELPEMWNLSHPDVILQMHKDYLNAGAEVLTLNTFGANALKYNGTTTPSVDEIVGAAAALAKQAIRETGREGSAWIALDMGPTGKLLKPMGDLEFERAVDLYKEVVLAGVKHGVDLAIIETMSDTYELKAAVLAVKENSDLPIFATTIYGENGKMLTGGNVPAAVALLEGLGVDALGANCGLGPEQMLPIAEELAGYSSTPILISPNAGLPRSVDGRTVFDITPEVFAGWMVKIAQSGAMLLGGCCGTTPDHIRAMVEAVKELPPVPVTEKNNTVISSFAETVFFGDSPVLIGERINPTGKSKFKQALREENYDYILQEGLSEQEAGCHVLDVNVGLPGIDEARILKTAVTELQAIIDLPLQIDTADVTAMEQALRIYNGKALINSVNGKQENMEAVFPLVKKYGGVLVCLLLDESGIPATADGRLAIADKIIRTAASYGIARKDLILDPLCMTISTDPTNANTTLEAVRRIRDELHLNTILGVSNISFGLPQRPLINQAFFTMALQNGLSAGIVNPNSQPMMQAYDTYLALSGLDPQCSRFVEKYSRLTVQTTVTSAGSGAAAGASAGAAVSGASASGSLQAGAPLAGFRYSLKQCIERGLKDQAAAITKEMLKTADSMEIINGELIPALNVVGEKFEKGTLFLPQLLSAAESAAGSFDVIKDHLAASGTAREKKGDIVIATVKGDIHDIGKNIVKVLLENYDFHVIDLGKDVPPERIVEVTVEHHIPLVGLSALMTTTVVNMEETIKQLHESAPWAKVMVGGAVLTQDYADQIGADFYSKDAMNSVRYAEELFSAGKLS